MWDWLNGDFEEPLGKVDDVTFRTCSKSREFPDATYEGQNLSGFLRLGHSPSLRVTAFERSNNFGGASRDRT